MWLLVLPAFQCIGKLLVNLESHLPCVVHPIQVVSILLVLIILWGFLLNTNIEGQYGLFIFMDLLSGNCSFHFNNLSLTILVINYHLPPSFFCRFFTVKFLFLIIGSSDFVWRTIYNLITCFVRVILPVLNSSKFRKKIQNR